MRIHSIVIVEDESHQGYIVALRMRTANARRATQCLERKSWIARCPPVAPPVQYSSRIQTFTQLQIDPRRQRHIRGGIRRRKDGRVVPRSAYLNENSHNRIDFVEFDSRQAVEESIAKYDEGHFLGNKIRVELSRGVVGPQQTQEHASSAAIWVTDLRGLLRGALELFFAHWQVMEETNAKPFPTEITQKMTSSKAIAHKARVAGANENIHFDVNPRSFNPWLPAPLSNEEEATSGTDDASSSQQLAPLADVEEEMEVILLVQRAWAGRLIPLKDGYTENASPSNSSRIVVKRPAKRTTPKPATPAKRPPTTQPDSGCPIRALKRHCLTNVYKGHQRVVDKSSLPSGAIQPKSRHRGIEGIGNCVKAHFRWCGTLVGSAEFFEEVYPIDVQEFSSTTPFVLQLQWFIEKSSSQHKNAPRHIHSPMSSPSCHSNCDHTNFDFNFRPPLD
ncbi:hypothetical protein B0H13DRAFT_1879277 [Mycena leptocephala]|nr:hypothetical protein B0H13DRAFT_1879277 [Mycena leptocephala]